MDKSIKLDIRNLGDKVPMWTHLNPENFATELNLGYELQIILTVEQYQTLKELLGIKK